MRVGMYVCRLLEGEGKEDVGLGMRWGEVGDGGQDNCFRLAVVLSQAKCFQRVFLLLQVKFHAETLSWFVVEVSFCICSS